MKLSQATIISTCALCQHFLSHLGECAVTHKKIQENSPDTLETWIIPDDCPHPDILTPPNWYEKITFVPFVKGKQICRKCE